MLLANFFVAQQVLGHSVLDISIVRYRMVWYGRSQHDVAKVCEVYKSMLGSFISAAATR